MKVKPINIEKIDAFNTFALTHKFYSVTTGLSDQPYFIDIGWQITINPKCEALYVDLVRSWQLHNKQF